MRRPPHAAVRVCTYQRVVLVHPAFIHTPAAAACRVHPHMRATPLFAARRWATVGEKSGGESIVHDIDSSDPFQNLGVTRFSTPAEVQANFKKLALMYHPDRPGGDQAKFSKLMEAKEMCLHRLGEKEDDDVDETVTHHEPEYTYNEEKTQWEFKRGKMRVYDDYVDTGVERQRITVWLVQIIIGACIAWVMIENFVEQWFTSTVAEDQWHVEGRMFAAGKRRDYEKESEALYLLKFKKGANENDTYVETFAVEDPFAEKVTKRKRKAMNWVDAMIMWVERFLPVFGHWLRFWLLPDTVRTAHFA